MYSYFVLFTFWEALNIGLPLCSSFPCFWIKLKIKKSNLTSTFLWFKMTVVPPDIRVT